MAEPVQRIMKTVIVIHGVGDPPIGEVATMVAKSLNVGDASVARVLVDGHECTQIEALGSGYRILEVNWADLQRPRSSVLGIARHLWLLVCGMVLVLESQMSEAWPRRFVAAYAYLLTVVTPGSVFLALGVFLSLVSDRTAGRVLGLVACLSLAAVWALWTSRYSPWRYSPWVWCSAMALALFPAFGAVAPADRAAWIATVSFVYSSAQIVTYLFVLAACGAVLLRGERASWTTRLTWLAHVYVPYLVVNGFMILLACAALFAATQYGARYRALMDLVAVPFDLASVERIATIVIGGIGVTTLIAAAVYLLLPARNTEGSSDAPDNPRGRIAQESLRFLLTAVPIALALVAAVYVHSFWTYLVTGDRYYGDIFKVYQESLLRVLPFLPWLVGPLAIVLGIVGDVVFYLLPPHRSAAGIGDVCRLRFTAVLDYSLRLGDPVAVLAHSQGSRIATDVLARSQSAVSLITLGSPIGALYSRFLGHEPPSQPSGTLWLNSFREGDYIGGPISTAHNSLFGVGGHTGYWADPKIGSLVERAFGSA